MSPANFKMLIHCLDWLNTRRELRNADDSSRPAKHARPRVRLNKQRLCGATRRGFARPPASRCLQEAFAIWGCCWMTNQASVYAAPDWLALFPFRFLRPLPVSSVKKSFSFFKICACNLLKNRISTRPRVQAPRCETKHVSRVITSPRFSLTLAEESLRSASTVIDKRWYPLTPKSVRKVLRLPWSQSHQRKSVVSGKKQICR